MSPTEPATPELPVHDTLRELLQSHDVREQLVGILAEEIESRREPSHLRRLQPWPDFDNWRPIPPQMNGKG